MNSSRFLVAVLAALTPAFATVATAQEDVPRTTTSSPGIYRFVPANATLMLRTSGPSGFGRALGETNFYRLLQNDEMQAGIADLTEKILDLARESDAPPEMVDWMSGLVEVIGAYEGDMVVGLTFGSGLASALATEDPTKILETAQIFLSMTPSEGFDAQGFVDRVMAPAKEAGMPPSESMDVGPGFEKVALPFGEDVAVVLPRVVDGGVMLAFGAGLDGTLRSMFEGRSFDAAKLGSAESRSAASFYVDLTGVLPMVKAIMKAELDSQAEFLPESAVEERREEMELTTQVMEALGLGDLDSVSGTVGGLGDYVDYGMDLRFHGKAQRVFDLFRLADGQRLQMLNLVPRESTAGSVGFFNVKKAAELAFELMEEFGAPIGREDLEAELQGALGIDLQADVLDQLTGEVAMIQQYEAEAMEDADFVGGLIPFDMTFGLGIADSPRFADLVDTLLDISGMKPEIGQNEHAGVQVNTLGLGFFDLEFAFVPEGALLSVGNFEESRLRPIIDRSMAVAEGQADLSWSDAVQRRLDVVGRFDGIQISQIGDLGSSFEQMFDGVTEGMLMDPSTPPMVAEFMESFFGLMSTMVGSMVEAGLDSSVNASRVEDGVFRVRAIQ
ncbi:MAG: hypothetical protein AAF196_01995 [Planctomycetota bacterium]